MKINPMPKRFDKLFNTIMLDLRRYVDIMNPRVLIAAQVMTNDRMVHANVSSVMNPKAAISAPKKIKLGIDINNGARAIPSA